jgi:hypothetical protein
MKSGGKVYGSNYKTYNKKAVKTTQYQNLVMNVKLNH